MAAQAAVVLQARHVIDRGVDERCIVLEVLTAHAVPARRQGQCGNCRCLFPSKHDRKTTLIRVDELSRLRQELDGIDAGIVDAIADRFAMVRKIGDAKAQSGTAVRDVSREAVVFDNVRQRAVDLGISPQVITEVFTVLITGSLVEQGHDAAWKDVSPN